MSTGRALSHKSRSSSSRHHTNARPIPPQPTLTPENTERELEPCAATASHFLYAQRNLILCLRHDTLAIERRFDRHREDVRWISTDIVSERGAGRLAVSYDSGHTAIVWDIATGDEVARFAAYEEIRIATWMKNGNIAFGNVQGNVILFEPSTSEHVSARTIYDPITAIAPAADNRTFAIGYLNGSILIATLQPFTMVHSLNTSNAPSRVTGLAWHASASRQKSDMLATQTADGSLKVWSVPKVANGEVPNIIRILNGNDMRDPGPCWFAWSKLGRIIQHSGGETRSWDVRTKNVSYETVPTVDNVIGISNYAPNSTLFTLGVGRTVQQYDINPTNKPFQTASVQHAPANTPPSPPTSLEEQKSLAEAEVETVPTLSSVPIGLSDTETSESEGPTMSPIQRFIQETDTLADEMRDSVGPLSPVSSRASSRSSYRSRGRRAPSYRYDRPSSSTSNVSANEGTEFSFSQTSRQPVRDNISTQSISSFATSSFTSPRYRSPVHRRDFQRHSQEAKKPTVTDLFPTVRARLANVPFRTPHYGHVARTPDVLRKEMLSVVFGWNDDIEALVQDELYQHPPGSAGGVLLSQWLCDLGSEDLASSIGSESMTSADWMLLALSTMGEGSKKNVGEAFVHRLLEKGDIHPAAAMLLGLGEESEAIEVYVSRNCFLEAILLACLLFPSDWQRQSYLVRKWGETLVAQGQPELAVRCFSCTSAETSGPWSQPLAQPSRFSTQKEQPSQQLQSPLSPPSATGSGRLTTKNASLKLVTSFGDKVNSTTRAPSADATPMAPRLGVNVGVTPIADSAVSPVGHAGWGRNTKERDPSSARTATPGGFGRRRVGSRGESRRTRTPSETPLTAARDIAVTDLANDVAEQRRYGHGRRASSSISSSGRSQLLDPSSTQHGNRGISSSEHLPSPAHDVFARLKDESNMRNGSRDRLAMTLQVHVSDTGYKGSAFTSAPTTASDAGDEYENIGPSNNDRSSHGNASTSNRSGKRSHREKRTDSSRRDPSEIRGRERVPYVAPAKRSPSSPVPMSPEEVAAAKARQLERSDGEVFDEAQRNPARYDTSVAQELLSDGRGRRDQRTLGSTGRSPSAPLPKATDSPQQYGDNHTQPFGERFRSRQRSLSTQPLDRTKLPGDPGTRSCSKQRSDGLDTPGQLSATSLGNNPSWTETGIAPESSSVKPRNQFALTRKQLAAKELEERRASLARRPSAPSIPLPGESWYLRPPMAPRFHTDLGNSPTSSLPPLSAPNLRSRTVEPDEMMRFGPAQPGDSAPPMAIGLPATPRAMRHPHYMGTDTSDVPAVPDVSDVLPQLAPTRFGQPAGNSEADVVAPLLPSTVYSGKSLSSPQRAASVPLERVMRESEAMASHLDYKSTQPSSPNSRFATSRGHSRNTSQTESHSFQQQNMNHAPVTTTIDQTPNDTQVVVIDVGEPLEDVVLPQLQHLAMPPPPPPPPVMFSNQNRTSSSSLGGVINIAIEEEPTTIDVPPMIERAATTSPSLTMSSYHYQSQGHRHGRNSSISDNTGSRFRNLTDRLRSDSRSRTRPPQENFGQLLPYETVLPGITASTTRKKSVSAGMPIMEQVIPPENIGLPPSRSGSAFGTHRNPREVRANMPPEISQQGAYQSDNMI